MKAQPSKTFVFKILGFLQSRIDPTSAQIMLSIMKRKWRWLPLQRIEGLYFYDAGIGWDFSANDTM